MLTQAIENWLKQALEIDTLSYIPVNGGANNLGFIIKNSEKRAFLKCFDPTNASTQYKQLNEFTFSQVLYNSGITNIPAPIAINRQECASLFSFIDGCTVDKSSPNAISAAVDFLANVNQSTINKDKLNTASESAFSLFEFANIVTNRLKKFNYIKTHDTYINTQLNSSLSQIKERFELTTKALPVQWQEVIKETIVSPSDFGFHNALQLNNDYYFIDFEYAGIDSSWKLFTDIFAQPEIPIDLRYAPDFLASAIFKPLLYQPQNLLRVYELTLLKWCLIMLNEFLPEVQARRIFSWNKSSAEISNQQDLLKQAQLKQLKKCNDYFKNIPLKIEALSKVLREIS